MEWPDPAAAVLVSPLLDDAPVTAMASWAAFDASEPCSRRT